MAKQEITLELFKGDEIGNIDYMAKEIYKIKEVLFLGYNLKSGEIITAPPETRTEEIAICEIHAGPVWSTGDLDATPKRYITVNNGFDVKPHYQIPSTSEKVKIKIRSYIEDPKNMVKYEVKILKTMPMHDFMKEVKEEEIEIERKLHDPIEILANIDCALTPLNEAQVNDKVIRKLETDLGKIPVKEFYSIGDQITIHRGGDSMFDIWSLEVSPLYVFTNIYNIYCGRTLKLAALTHMKRTGVMFPKMKGYEKTLHELQEHVDDPKKSKSDSGVVTTDFIKAVIEIIS